jgi:hypothetical protein
MTTNICFDLGDFLIVMGVSIGAIMILLYVIALLVGKAGSSPEFQISKAAARTLGK